MVYFGGDFFFVQAHNSYVAMVKTQQSPSMNFETHNSNLYKEYGCKYMSYCCRHHHPHPFL